MAANVSGCGIAVRQSG